MAKAFIYRRTGIATIFFASSLKRAKYIAYKDFAEDESFSDMVVEPFVKLDFMDRPDGYVLDLNNPADKIELQKYGIIN